MTIAPEPWLDRAACTGAPSALFFPEDGDAGTRGKAICAGCPVRVDCLDYAVTNHIGHGTWGGFTARERTRRPRRLEVVRRATQVLRGSDARARAQGHPDVGWSGTRPAT